MSSIDPSEELVTEDSFYFASKEDGRVLAVFRLVAGPFGVHELRWGDSKWQPYDELVRRLMTGDPDLHKVDVDTVQQVTPYVDTSEYIVDGG